MSEEPTPQQEQQLSLDDQLKLLDAQNTRKIVQEGVEDSTSENTDAPAIEALTKQIEELKKQLEAQETKTIEAEKAVLLDRLKQANYNPDDFKDLDLKSLEITIKALSNKDGRIIVPTKEEDTQTIERDYDLVEVWDPIEKRFFDFHARRMGRDDRLERDKNNETNK